MFPVQSSLHSILLHLPKPLTSVFEQTLTSREYQSIQGLIWRALVEDISTGDITSQNIAESAYFTGVLTARDHILVAGLPVIVEILKVFVPDATLQIHIADGELVGRQTILAELHGPARDLLIVERTVLNLLQYLSGIATLTQSYVKRIVSTNAILLDTRKTIPGLRSLAKYATRVGGACNHRLSLNDGILIKDNHIALCGSITSAIRLAKVHTTVGIEIECDTLEQVCEAVDAGADIILLDNMPVDQLKVAVLLVNGQSKIEASGNITLDSVKDVAETGVDFISVGRITHSAPSADIGLDWKLL